MIGTGMGSSGAVRPFYNRPIEIVRRFLGHAQRAAGSVADLQIAPVVLGPTDTLMVAVATNNEPVVDNVIVTIDLTSLGAPNNGAIFAGGYQLMTYALAMNGSPHLTGIVKVDFTASTGTPTTAAAIAIAVSELQQAPASFDVHASAFGSASNQVTGFTPATSQAHEFLWGIVATSGVFPTDIPGSFQAPMTTGDRIGNGTIDLKEGFGIVHAINTYRTQDLGCTSRPFGALINTHRAA